MGSPVILCACLYVFALSYFVSLIGGLLLNKKEIRALSVPALCVIPGIWLLIQVFQAESAPAIEVAMKQACQKNSCRGLIGPIHFTPGFEFPAIILLAVGGILFLIALVFTIARCIRMKSWRWLAVTLLLGPVGILLYGLAGPADLEKDPPYWGYDPKKRRKATHP